MTVLLPANQHQLQDLVDQLNRYISELRLDIHNTKTIIISNEKERTTMNVTVNRDILEQVLSFSYLGHINKDND